MSEHRKHVAIKKPELGRFSRNEWSIHGTTCHSIQQMVETWLEDLNPVFKTAFLDASHQEANDPQPGAPNFQYRTTPEGLEMTQRDAVLDYDLAISLRSVDLLLINGNHFTGKTQIVVLDELKRESLNRKLDRLTNISLLLTTEEHPEAYEFLNPLITEGTTILRLEDTQAITQWLREQMKKQVPKLKGLVLAGGRSIRMGKDKGDLKYYEKDQREHTAELLKGHCDEVFISCRPDQLDTIHSEYPLLPDTFLGLGPLGAILSAFQHDPDSAWLVVACDLPLLNKETLNSLIKERDPGFLATAFQTGEHGFPEPLITIWEPEAYPRALDFLALGHSCPRKVLINSNTKKIAPSDPDALTNVNTGEERDIVLKNLNK